ncbi:MAG: DUF1330 domain-containing protein [Reichenbachiella sp.]
MKISKSTLFHLALVCLWSIIIVGCDAPTQTEVTPAVETASDALPPGIISKEEPKTFVEIVNKINATPAFLEALLKQPDNGPTINLNLLKYRPRGNRARYDLYGAVAGGEIVGVGGDIVYHGEGITDMPAIFQMSDEWDGVAYAMYPRRAAYAQLQQDVDYQLAIPDRVAGTYERMLYLLSDGDAIYNASSSISEFHKNNTRVVFEEGNVVVSEFLRFKKDGGRASYEKFAKDFQPMLKEIGGEVVLSCLAEMPIVSEEYWDHFVSFRFPSMKAMKDLYQSGKFNEINANRLAGIEATLAVVSEPQKMPAKPTN